MRWTHSTPPGNSTQRPGSHNIIGMAQRLDSNYPEAIEALQTANSLAGHHPWTLNELALTYAALGDRDQAEAIYEELVDRAYEERDATLNWVSIIPHLDPLRDDPRFAKLLERMGLD